MAFYKKQIVAWIIMLGFAIMLIIYIFLPKFYLIKKNAFLSKFQLDQLDILGQKAITTLDVPVSSIVVYNDSIIGVGYNTLIANGDAGGHAEINAISSAIKKMSWEKFKKLDRDKLTLITTYEPCAMCRGAIIEYRVNNVIFIKGKSISHHLKENLKKIRYEWNKHSSEQQGLQDSLFYLYPGYKEKQK